jgi:ribosome modulation factor
MSTDTKPTTPFATGYTAFERGKNIHQSPYPEGSRDRTKWVNGWQWAQRQAQKAADAAQLAAIEARPLPDWVTAEEALK